MNPHFCLSEKPGWRHTQTHKHALGTYKSSQTGGTAHGCFTGLSYLAQGHAVSELQRQRNPASNSVQCSNPH